MKQKSYNRRETTINRQDAASLKVFLSQSIEPRAIAGMIIENKMEKWQQCTTYEKAIRDVSPCFLSTLCRVIAEPDQILFLLLVARLQLEQACRGAAENVVLALFGEERQVVD